MTKGIVVNADKCTGCRTCELTCSFIKNDLFNPKDSAMKVLSYDEIKLKIPSTCIQCEEPECMAACPTGAIIKDEETGVVTVNHEECIDCMVCVEACPFDSIEYSPRLEKIIKCDLCQGNPQCVRECPSDAIEFKETEGISNKYKNIEEWVDSVIKEVAK